MTTATDVELDQATRDELAPLCESRKDDNPATRILHWDVACEHATPHTLYCTQCAERLVALLNAARGTGRVVCTTCGITVQLLRVEPLR